MNFREAIRDWAIGFLIGLIVIVLVMLVCFFIIAPIFEFSVILAILVGTIFVAALTLGVVVLVKWIGDKF